MERKVSPFFKFFKKLLGLLYPKTEFYGTENLTGEPMIFAGNHSQMAGPIICELSFPVSRYTWCAGQMMNLKEVPAYAYKDFWSEKPKFLKPFYKLASYLIAPFSVFIFNNANTVAVYKSSHGLSTYKDTIKLLNSGESIVIFPEHNQPHNHIIYDFQDKFIDVARLYYKKHKKEIFFVPMYIAPRLKEVHFGKPIRYCSANSADEERARIKEYLMKEITEIAVNLPTHTVVPYRNIPKKYYPKNKESKVAK